MEIFTTQTELIKTLPVTKAQPYNMKTLYSLPLTLEAGYIVHNICAQFEVTNGLGFNVMLAHSIAIANEENQTVLAVPAAENITPDIHHGFRSLNAMPFRAPKSGDYILSVVVYAAASNALTSSKLVVEQGYGHLACVVTSA